MKVKLIFFFFRYEDDVNFYYDKVFILYRMLISEIGEKYGVIDDYFDRNKNVL